MTSIKASEFDFNTVDDDVGITFLIEAKNLAEFINPLEVPRWTGVSSAITHEEVLDVVNSGGAIKQYVGPGSWLQLGLRGTPTKEAEAIVRAEHIGRIAAFVEEMPDDPIVIDVGSPSFDRDMFGEIVLEDGHHRLAAAIILDKPILTSFIGEWEVFQSLFPDSVYKAGCQEKLSLQM